MTWLAPYFSNMVEFLDEVGIDGFLEVVSVVVLDAVEKSDEFALQREACVYS